MEFVLKYFSGLSPSQRLLWLGNIGMVLSALSTGFFGYQIVEGMNIYVFGAGTLMSLIGWYGTQKDKQRAFIIKLEGARLREKKIDAGINPSFDKTIIKLPD